MPSLTSSTSPQNPRLPERLCMPWLDFGGAACAEPGGGGELNGRLEGACALAEEETALWKPLVLLIPLRLGLTDINEAYIETLKVRWTEKAREREKVIQAGRESNRERNGALLYLPTINWCRSPSFLCTAMLHAASILGGYRWETKQCPLLHRLCRYVQSQLATHT